MFMIALWLLILAGLFFLVKKTAKESGVDLKFWFTGLDVLKDQYARGETDSEEFERKKQYLHSLKRNKT